MLKPLRGFSASGGKETALEAETHEVCVFIAIDPGVSGGIAYEDTDGSVHAVPMPDTVVDQLGLLKTLVCDQTVVVIEEVPMFVGKMNQRSTAVLFRRFGQLEGILASLRARVEYMKPQHWQGALRLGKKADHGSRWKAHLKSRAQALFPKVDVTLKTADALLILEAARGEKPLRTLRVV